MAIWTKDRLVLEAETNPCSLYQEVRARAKQSAPLMTDEDLDEMIPFEQKLISARYCTWNEKYDMAFEVPCVMINRYSRNQYVIPLDFAAELAATDLYSVSFNTTVVFMPMELHGEDNLCLIDPRHFEKTLQYMVSAVPGEMNRLPVELTEELERYRYYLNKSKDA